MSRTIVAVVGFLVSLVALQAQAQDAAILSRLYGTGVHSYFAGEYSKAYDDLNKSIETGSQDPRAFYFRGLSLLKLGRTDEAVVDFKKGAELECADVNKTFNVPKSLERVQGEGRRQIEIYRAESRKIAFAREEKLRKARYETLRREEERVLLRQAEGGAFSANVEPEATPAVKTPKAAAEPTAPKTKKKVEVKKAAEEEVDPFAAPSAEKAPAAKPAPQKPVEKKPAEKPADKSDDEANPFG